MSTINTTVKVIKAKGLTGDKNQCPSCGELFLTSDDFSAHKAGQIGVDRRCLSAQEMGERGGNKVKGFWNLLGML